MSKLRKSKKGSPGSSPRLPWDLSAPLPLSFFVHFSNGHIHLQLIEARWTMEDVADRLNTDTDGVSHLVKEKLLKPIGNPTKNKQKYFNPEDVLELMRNRSWLGKMTNCLYLANEKKNAGTQRPQTEGEAPPPSSGDSNA